VLLVSKLSDRFLGEMIFARWTGGGSALRLGIRVVEYIEPIRLFLRHRFDQRAGQLIQIQEATCSSAATSRVAAPLFYGYYSPGSSTSLDLEGLGSLASAVKERFLSSDVPPLTRFPDTSGDFTVNLSVPIVAGADPF
jgi:hypothetical protein